MAMIRVSCPHCSFSRDVPDTQLPDQPVKAHCPKCKQSFDFFQGGGSAVILFFSPKHASLMPVL